jgi:S-adenosylmethionine:tRNA ribosyltransferase-isomerase
VKTQELDYDLPNDLIATEPVDPRDAARMLVLNRQSGATKDSHFFDILNYLKQGDVIVLNKTKVFPARIFGHKKTGGRVEVVFLSEKKPMLWEVIIGGKVADGQILDFGHNFSGIVHKEASGLFLEVSLNKDDVFLMLEKTGQMPLPPYMNRSATESDKSDYQTVFARDLGSAAAPTAGLHFTKSLLKKIKDKGVEIECVTLHVGLGTFAPVKTEVLEDHPIHSEYFEIDNKTAGRLNEAKKRGGRIIACGTTVMRTLEAAALKGEVVPQKNETKLFIYPGYKFQFVDGLITNFHTPKSSLLALVFAFAGQKETMCAYQHSIEEKYRFFSYGDGMLII